MRRTDLDALEMELGQVNELIRERKDPDAGRVIAERLLMQLRQQGKDSAYLEWLIAIALDYSSRWLEAVEHIERAHAADPLDPAYLSSRRIIFAKLRSALLGTTLDAEGPTIVEMHTALSEREEANVDCHLHLAHWYAGQQRWDEMRRLLDAVLLLYPGCREAWQAMTLFAAGRGDVALLESAQSKLRDLSPDLSPAEGVDGRS